MIYASCYTAACSSDAASCLALRTTQMVFTVVIQPYLSYAPKIQVTLYATLLYIIQAKAECSVDSGQMRVQVER